MTIALRGTAITASGTLGASTLTVTKPTGVVSGDVWIIGMSVHQFGCHSDHTDRLDRRSPRTAETMVPPSATRAIYIRLCDGTGHILFAVAGGLNPVVLPLHSRSQYATGSIAYSGAMGRRSKTRRRPPPTTRSAQTLLPRSSPSRRTRKSCRSSSEEGATLTAPGSLTQEGSVGSGQVWGIAYGDTSQAVAGASGSFTWTGRAGNQKRRRHCGAAAGGGWL